MPRDESGAMSETRQPPRQVPRHERNHVGSLTRAPLCPKAVPSPGYNTPIFAVEIYVWNNPAGLRAQNPEIIPIPSFRRSEETLEEMGETMLCNLSPDWSLGSSTETIQKSLGDITKEPVPCPREL